MSLRAEVFKCYRLLHRARMTLFAGDTEALQLARMKIKQAFMENAHLSETNEILEQIKMGEETAEYMKKAIVQARFCKENNSYEIKITKDTHLNDNVDLAPEHTIDLSKYEVPDKYK